MRVLTATEPDNVGGGLVFNGNFSVYKEGIDFIDIGTGGNRGGGSGYSGGGGGAAPGGSSGGAGYGANLVDPIACKADVEKAGFVGAGIGAGVGAFFGKSVGAIGIGLVTGAVLGGFYGLKSSPACQPKTP